MNNNLSGLIFDIRRYSVNDGPGIRTTIFLKGCPLKCAWCHNPESQKHSIETLKRIRHLDGKTHIQTESCGYVTTTDELLEEIKKDSICFEESNGGVTISGGEPLRQPDFVFDLLEKLNKQGFHSALDTCGYSPNHIFKRVTNLANLVLYDIKCISEALHVTYTNRSNKVILENLYKLSSSGKPFIIRIPVIPNFNDNPTELILIDEFIRSLPNKPLKLELLPFHSIGLHKYNELEKTIPELHPPHDKLANIQLAESILLHH